MKTIFLQQDASEKIKVEIPESELITSIKKYFGWRKDVTASRLNKLGTSQRDKFIKHISSRY